MTGINSTDNREHHTNPNGHAQRKVGKLSEIGEDKRYVTQQHTGFWCMERLLGDKLLYWNQMCPLVNNTVSMFIFWFWW